MTDLQPRPPNRRSIAAAESLTLGNAPVSLGIELGRVASKVTVAALSLFVIYWLVGDVAVIPFLCGVAGTTYVAIALADRLIALPSWRIAAAILFAAALYGGLLALNVAGIVGNLTGNPNSVSLRNQWVVTIGIGFYTLQIIGVAIDVLRRRIALPPLLDYVFYILYLPKFLSGPIEQATFLDKVRTYRLQYVDSNLATGLPWLVLGLFMKFAVADSVSHLVDINYVRPLGLVVITALFELRVYFDWAGYSLMAYGAAWCLGLPVMLNFAQPLFAHNPQALWRRWHISLGRWFHEYLYLPLKQVLTNPVLFLIVAPVTVFALSAMWHGVSFNFLLWGIFHASAYLLFVHVLRHIRAPRVLGILGFILLLLVGRLLFMDDDTTRLLTKFAHLASAEAWRADVTPAALRAFADHMLAMPQTKAGAVGVLAGVILICVEWINEHRYPKQPYRLLTHPTAAIVIAAATLLLASSSNVGFVYARF